MRQAVEQDLDIDKEFAFLKQLEKELTATKKEQRPVTACIFNEVKEFKSQTQDGRGGSRPNDCSLQEKEKADEW